MEPVVSCGLVGHTPMRELAWRRVADDSHDLWCACMDWKAHVEYVVPLAEDILPRPESWPAQVEAQWRLQIKGAHDVWCQCGDWRGHALRSRSLTLDSNSSRSSRSSTCSYVSVASCPAAILEYPGAADEASWWKRVKGRFRMRGWWERWLQRRRQRAAEKETTQPSSA
ncbi:Rh181 [macacine betaherpesvirus 3]|nr:Rh181 [macacine betaherpesvirus 3]